MNALSLNEFPCVLDTEFEYCHLREKYSVACSYSELIQRMSFELSDMEDRAFVWVGLARVQIRRKELLPEVAEKALSALDEIKILADKNGYRLQKTSIDRLREKLNDKSLLVGDDKLYVEPRPIKKREFRCPWSIGDMFCWQLRSDEADALGLMNAYVILRKVDQCDHDKYGWLRTFPVVYLIITRHIEHFEDQDAVMTVDYIQTGSHKIVQLRKEIPRRREYRVELIVNSYAQLRKAPFRYLGNNKELGIPADEVVIAHTGTSSRKQSSWVLPTINLKNFEHDVCQLYSKYGTSDTALIPWDSDLNYI